jgi:DNA-binding Lrp family transcriptional regulator
MDYRTQLKTQLARRREVNPRYSLRAFAKKLGLSPSKLSEILAKKRNLGAVRAGELVDRLGLVGRDREAFLLSVALDAAQGPEKQKLKRRLTELAEAGEPAKTKQRNAWYFGAVAALDAAGHDASRFAVSLGLTPLQIENARRYRDRMCRFFPERSALSFEPVSVLQRISDGHIGQSDAPLEAEFIYLDDARAERLALGIQKLVRELAAGVSDHPPAGDLRLVHWGLLKLTHDRSSP